MPKIHRTFLFYAKTLLTYSKAVIRISLSYLKEVIIIVNQLLKEQERLTNKLQQIRTSLAHSPNGKLICAKNSTHFKWYVSDGSQHVYLPKKEVSKAQKLALKKYYLFQESEIIYQLNILNQFLNKYQKCPHKSSELLSPDSPYYQLLLPYFKEENDYFSWASEPYRTNPHHPENLIHKCISGHLVRSKSEVIIANTLFVNHIPFRYECELYLNNIVLYPDFTILHPLSGKTFYWEHFGMIDNPTYRENTFNKLKTYGNNGIYPSINLFTTYETSTCPIDSTQVQNIINDLLQR